MRPARDIKRSIKNLDWNIDIDTKTDRKILDELVDLHRTVAPPPSGVNPVEGGWATGGDPSRGRLGYMGLAAVVLIAIAIALLVTHRRPSEPRPMRTVSSLELATAMSLEKAFRQGGIEAVDRQSRKAFHTGRRNTEPPSIAELLRELETEMNDLGSKSI